MEPSAATPAPSGAAAVGEQQEPLPQSAAAPRAGPSARSSQRSGSSRRTKSPARTPRRRAAPDADASTISGLRVIVHATRSFARPLHGAGADADDGGDINQPQQPPLPPDEPPDEAAALAAAAAAAAAAAGTTVVVEVELESVDELGANR